MPISASADKGQNPRLKDQADAAWLRGKGKWRRRLVLIQDS